MFGGSFDPPHLAHIEIVNRLIEDCDKLYIFPAKQSPYKVNEVVSDRAPSVTITVMSAVPLESAAGVRVNVSLLTEAVTLVSAEVAE